MENKKCRITLELDKDQLDIFKSILAVTKATTRQEVEALRAALQVEGPRRLLSMQKEQVLKYIDKAMAESVLINSIVSAVETATENLNKKKSK